MSDSLKIYTPTEAEELADLLPWMLTGAREALETKDAKRQGRAFARQLAEAASKLEQHCIKWEKERATEKAQKQ